MAIHEVSRSSSTLTISTTALPNSAAFRQMPLDERQCLAAFCLCFTIDLLHYLEGCEREPHRKQRYSETHQFLAQRAIDFGPPECDEDPASREPENDEVLARWNGPWSRWPWTTAR